MNNPLMQRGNCPVCGSSESADFLKNSIRKDKIGSLTFASRKKPEFMNYHLRKCSGCGLVYACEHPVESEIITSYEEAAFGSDSEADDAARCYAALIRKNLPKNLGFAIDVGSGNGALLPLLSAMGFRKVTGYEPSAAAYANASQEIKDNMVHGVFDENSIPDNSADLIIICMTLEHVLDPLRIVRNAYRKLAVGGRLFVTDHNYNAFINRFLGKKSPIIDIEHLQLFNKNSLSFLLRESGFRIVRNASYWNRYKLSCFLMLLPIGGKFRQALEFLTKPFRNMMLQVPLGNRFAVGEKVS